MTQNHSFLRKAIRISALSALSGATLCAQSVDNLLDKLVDKGVLTVREANELRDESDKNFTQAYQVKTGMPDWVNTFRINGDVRGRYEQFSGGSTTFNDRHRFRYRLRVGATAVMRDNFEVGFRLTSSERSDNFGGDPISGNTTFGDNASKKFVFIDTAYAKWSAINTPLWNGVLTLGKMENPFVFSDLVFDGDYTPEGLAQQLVLTLSDAHALKLNFGEFVLDEIGGRDDDPFLFGAQIRFDSTWNTKLSTSFGLAGLVVTDEERLSHPYNGGIAPDTAQAVPNGQSGNLYYGSPIGLPAAGAPPAAAPTQAFLASHFNPIVVDGAVTYALESFPMYAAPFPIRLAADYIYNPGASRDGQGYSVGLTFGKAGKRKLWEVGYRWKELQANAWWEELVDSDFGGFYRATSPYNVGSGAGYRAGTNIRGHIFQASYSPTDSLTLGAKGFITEVINEVPAGQDSDMFRLQIDAVWKF